MKEESTKLYFKDASADKVYIVNLVERESGWWVAYSYGRRGGSLKTGMKTTEGTTFDKAKVIYDKLIHAKQLKGYTISEEEVAHADNPNAGEATGFMPQLLNEVTREEAIQYYEDNEGYVCLQTKWDGERRGVLLSPDETITTNRRGLQVNTTNEILADLKELRVFCEGDLVLDTEDMGDYLVVFDNYNPGEDLSFLERCEQLFTINNAIGLRRLKHLRIESPYQPESLEEFLAFIDAAEADKEEGVVIRKITGLYRAGKPNSGGDCLKLKFTASATCVVTRHNDSGKRSVHLGVRKGFDDEFTIIDIGKVTIPPNYDIPPVGAFVEIIYMNIMSNPGAKLFQPRFKGVRSDKTNADWWSSLKFKKES